MDSYLYIQSRAKIIGKSPNQNEGELFRLPLKGLIDINHELVLFAERIDWEYFEMEFAPPYSSTGILAIPKRFMAGCMMLKHIYNLGDEPLTYERRGCGAMET